MNELFPEFGAYFWWILAGVLLIAEMIQPGFFMIWLGAAAALTALIHFVAPMSWQAEVAIFAVLSAIVVALSWRVVARSRVVSTDKPHLNQRNAAFVGHTYPLAEAIVDGTGKIKAEATVWDVRGPDLPKGTLVKVTATDGLRLIVAKN
jgi:inner membrane protein